MTTNPLAKSSRTELQQRLDDARARLSAALDAEHAAVSRGDSDERIAATRRNRENVQQAIESFERELHRRVTRPEHPDQYAERLRALSDYHDGIAGRSGPPMHYIETVAGVEVHHTLNTDDLRAIADMLDTSNDGLLIGVGNMHAMLHECLRALATELDDSERDGYLEAAQQYLDDARAKLAEARARRQPGAGS